MSIELIDIIGTFLFIAVLCFIFYFLGYMDGSENRED